jgi:type IV fimbrial biogenesis protein FimT
MQARVRIVAPMDSASPVRSIRGVSLVELLTVIGIVAILTAIGLPSYQYVTSRNRISGEINGLLGDLQYARAEAIKEGQTVSVCVSNGTTCLPSSAWQSGWMVFSDLNGTGVYVAGPGENILRVQAPFTSTDTFGASNNVQAIIFNREGFAQGLPAGGVLITLDANPPSTASTRCLALTLVGMMTVQTYGGGCL